MVLLARQFSSFLLATSTVHRAAPPRLLATPPQSHGAHVLLDFVGFDDKEAEDRKIMRREERKVLDFVQDLGLWPDFLLAPEGEGE